jgi:hypothetical protein
VNVQWRLKNWQGSLKKPVAGELKRKSHQPKDISIELDAVTCQRDANKADFRRAERKQAASQVKVTAGGRMATLCIPIASDSRRFIYVLVAAINSELSDPRNIQTYRHKVASKCRF